MIKCDEYFKVFPQNFTKHCQFFYDEFNNFFGDKLLTDPSLFSGFTQRQFLDDMDDISFNSENARSQVLKLVQQDTNFNIDNFKTFCLTQKNTVAPMVSTLALMSGLAVIYLFRK